MHECLPIMLSILFTKHSLMFTCPVWLRLETQWRIVLKGNAPPRHSEYTGSAGSDEQGTLHCTQLIIRKLYLHCMRVRNSQHEYTASRRRVAALGFRSPR